MKRVQTKQINVRLICISSSSSSSSSSLNIGRLFITFGSYTSIAKISSSSFSFILTGHGISHSFVFPLLSISHQTTFYHRPNALNPHALIHFIIIESNFFLVSCFTIYFIHHLFQVVHDSQCRVRHQIKLITLPIN